MRIQGWMAGIAAASLGAAALVSSEVQAGKPGGGGGTVEGGTIYVIDYVGSAAGVVKAITSSGSVTATYPDVDVAAGYRSGVGDEFRDRRLEPSRALHDSRRWFLQERVGSGGVHEVYALAQDGQEVRLTDCATAGLTLDANTDGLSLANLKWVGPDDAAMSFGAFRSTSGAPADGGIYRIALDWDAIAAGSFDAVQPGAPWLGVGPFYKDFVGTNYVWSPDGERCAYIHIETAGSPPSQSFSLRVAADDGSGSGADVSSTSRASFHVLCDWTVSNGDDVLLLVNWGAIDTLNLRTMTGVNIAANGGTSSQVYRPCWSPAASQVLNDRVTFTRNKRTGEVTSIDWNVMRTAASGSGGATDLTGFGTDTFVLGWR